MRQMSIDYGMLGFCIVLLNGLVSLSNAAEPLMRKSLSQLKNKAHMTSTATPQVQPTTPFNTKRMQPQASKSLHEMDEAEHSFRLLHDNSDDLTFHPYDRTAPHGFNLPMSMFDSYAALAAMSQTAKMLQFFGYAQPIFIPYPMGVTPEMLYPTTEESMSRARRPTNRNSPIYYMRLPPTPYMFLPNFSPATAINPFIPFAPHVSSFHALPMSSVFNLPMNFLANGKPNGIYRIDGSSTDLQHEQFPPAASSHAFGFRPTSHPSSLTPEIHKLSSSKSPYVFNGRPDDIYILPNNFNSIYSEGNFY